MPDYRNLTLLLFLAACERSDTSTTPEPKVAPEPAPVAEPAPPPAPAPEVKAEKAPAVAPVAPEPAPAPKPVVVKKPALPTAADLDHRCMSRAGCNWEKEERPRVMKKETP